MSTSDANKLPASGPRREALRAKGQFWTPDWTADLMAAYVLMDQPRRLLDPAVGEGAFFRAAKRYSQARGFQVELFGREVDPEVLAKARNSGLTEEDLRRLELRDFVLDPPSQRFPAIIANPPYLRHHRLSKELKNRLRLFAREAAGLNIDGRAGLHVYFLLRSLLTLAPGGRLAFIVSADVCEGVFAGRLWRWICSNYRLEYTITFAPSAAPFPQVDANAIVFLISNARSAEHFLWVKCLERDPEAIISLFSGPLNRVPSSLEIRRRSLVEALENGLSRPPTEESKARHQLADFAMVMRGIVTGDNDFFFMTPSRAKELNLPESLLVPALGRVRDVKGEFFNQQDLERLEAEGRPTRLLSINEETLRHLPEPAQKYLIEGESRGLPEKPLLKTRTPWFRMERRTPPPILFAYLGRRNARFVRNLAGVVPLTCLLCVYPRHSSSAFVDRLFRVLSHPETIDNLRKVGKSYGADAIKVEPRALERLPLPDHLVEAEGLAEYLAPKQCVLDFGGM